MDAFFVQNFELRGKLTRLKKRKNCWGGGEKILVLADTMIEAATK
jgi:hypothetical protein